MSLTDEKRARRKASLLPDFVKKEITTEQKKWKEAILEKLPDSIKCDSPIDIDFWFNALDLYSTFETFTLTKEETESLVTTIYNFIITTTHYHLVIPACSLFTTLLGRKDKGIKLQLDWKPIYKLLYDCMLSHSKTNLTTYPQKITDSIIVCIRYARNFWADGATEQILDEWSSLLEPRYQTFALGQCLLSLFLPVNKGHHGKWINLIFDTWSMYRSVSFDFPFFELFTRLSRQGYEDVNWESILPFIFQAASTHLGLPSSVMEIAPPQVVGYHPECYSHLFKDFQSLDDVCALFASIIVNLLSGKTRELTRSLTVKLIALVAPFCSTSMRGEVDEDQCSAPVAFLDDLIAKYAKRVSTDRKGESKLEPLNEDDHNWFVELLTPLVTVSQFHEDPPLEQVHLFAQLAPSVVVPSLLNAVSQSLEFDHLKTAALKVLCSVTPTVLYTKEFLYEFMAIVQKAADEITFMDPEKSSVVFGLLYLVCTQIQIGPEYDSFSLNVASRCVEFCKHAVGDDFKSTLNELLLMMSRFVYAVPKKTAAKIASIVKSEIEDIPESAVCVIVESLDVFGPPAFSEKAIEAKTERDFILLKAISRSVDQGFIDRIEVVTESIIRGIESSDKKIRLAALSAAKWVIRNMANTYPLLPTKQGFIKAESADIKWHVPTPREIDVLDTLCAKLIGKGKEMLGMEGRQKQSTGVSTLRIVLKGLLSAISTEDMECIPDPRGLTLPPVSIFHSPKLVRRFEEAGDILIEALSSSKTVGSVLSYIMEVLDITCAPRDPLSEEVEGLDEEYKDNSSHGRVSVLASTDDAITQSALYWKSLHLASIRFNLCNVGMSKLTRRALEKAFELATHPIEKVRTRAGLYVNLASSNFRNHFNDLLQNAISQFQEGQSDEHLAGLAGVIGAVTSCIAEASTVRMAFRAAAAICIQLSPDEKVDEVRNLRQLLILLIDQTDAGDKQIRSTPPLSEERRWLAREGMRRHSVYLSSRETQNYAAALVCAVITGDPVIMDEEILGFVVSLLATDDKIVRECVIHLLPKLIEQLIPRVARPTRENVEEVNEENYDRAEFKDWHMRNTPQREAFFLDRSEYLDAKIVKQHFPECESEERVRMHRMLFERLSDSNELLDSFIKMLIDGASKEDGFSKQRISFWSSLCRFLGGEFTTSLFGRLQRLIETPTTVVNHVVAAEIFAGVLRSLKTRTYKYISGIAESVKPFVLQVINGVEPEYHNVWYYAFFSNFNELDPRRFFWLTDFLIKSSPATESLRSSRSASLICDILVDAAYGVRGIGKEIESIASQHLFSKKALEYDQVRECSARCLNSLLAISYSPRLRGKNPESRRLLERFLEEGVKDEFITRWLVTTYSTQSLSTLSAGEFCLDSIERFAALIMDKDEDDERIARAGLLELLSSNWLGSLGGSPLTVEAGGSVCDRILRKLMEPQREWQVSVLMTVLLEAFVSSTFFYVTEAQIGGMIEPLIQGLKDSHTDSQDVSVQMLSFLFRSSTFFQRTAPEVVGRFIEMLSDQTDVQTRIGGAKGLCAAISGTVLIDVVPQYVIDGFRAMLDTMENDKSVEPTIDQFMGDFWALNDNNLPRGIMEQLAPFHISGRPSYFS